MGLCGQTGFQGAEWKLLTPGHMPCGSLMWLGTDEQRHPGDGSHTQQPALGGFLCVGRCVPEPGRSACLVHLAAAATAE